MIWAREMPSHAYLPYIPSFRLTHSLTWSLPFFKAFSPKLGLTHRFVAKQTRFNPATDLIANSPEAYHLMGFDVSFSVPMREGQSLRVGLIVSTRNTLTAAATMPMIWGVMCAV